MSKKTTQLIEKLFTHITQMFPDVLSFHAQLCICAKPFWILFSISRWSYNIGYTLCGSAKPASCTYFKGTANWMHGQLVFVIEVRVGYVQYFMDLKYCFQFIACYFVAYRITLIQSDTKNGNFWKTQQKLKKSKKKNLLTEIEPLQLAF